VFLGVKIPKTLNKAVEKYIEVDTHATKSDFVRSAIREKISRDAPWIMEEILKKRAKEANGE